MADHVGVYAISGAFMPNPGTTALRTTTPTGVLVSRSQESTTNEAGSIIVALQIPPATSLTDYGNEVISLNAKQSGTQVIESSSAGVIVEIPTYYSKATRLNHDTYKHPSSLTDVFNSIPSTAPSASVSGGVHVYQKYIGSLASTIPSGAVGPFVITLSNAADSSPIITASLGNIVYIVSGAFSAAFAISTATVPGGGQVSMTPLHAQDRSYAFTSGAVYLHSWVPLSSSVSGVYLNNTFYDPIQVEIPITSSGKIRDVRVWIELVHDYRNAQQSQIYHQAGVSQSAWGLQTLQVALRSPNTNFRAAHPLWNAPGADILPIRGNATLTGTNNRFGDTYLGVPELLKNSYLLWEGHTVDEGPSDVLGDVSTNYHEFDYDIDMRTVFWDGSPNHNPRDMSYLHPVSGASRPWIDIAIPSISGTEYQSPSSYAYRYPLTVGASQLYYNVSLSGIITGSDIPWMVDDRLDCGNIVKTGSFFDRAVESVPPQGWLSTTDAQVKGWQTTFVSSSLSKPFCAGRIAARTTNNQVYMFGGENVNGSGLMSQQVAVFPFYFDSTVQQVTLQSGTVLANSSMPVARSKMGVTYYTSNAGEHVIMVGGATASGDVTGSTTVFFGDFAGADISWTSGSSSQLASSNPMVDCSVHIFDNVAYVLGGLSSGSYNPDVWGISIDPQTGRPVGSWSKIGPLVTTSTIDSVMPVRDPNTGAPMFIVGFSGSQAIAEISLFSGVFQPAFVINSGTSPAPTGTYRYPLLYDVGHVFAVFNSSSATSATFAAEVDTDGSPFNIHSGSWKTVGLNVPAVNSLASSGTSLVVGNVLFVGCGASTGSSEPPLYASTIIVAAPTATEFPTRGLQVGPASILPVYPLLDDVYSLKVFDQAPNSLAANHGPIRGFRPGLRNTELSGTWNLLLGMSAQAFDAISGSAPDPSVGVWFRQARLEFVYDQGVGLSEFIPSRSRKWTRPSLVPGQDGFQRVAIVSGAAAWEIGLNQTQVSQSPDYGRSVGITALTASSPASFAVQTYITGNLYVYLSGVGVVNPAWFLGGNGFGTPYIPDSSMSLGVTGTAEEIDASASQEMYRQTVGQATLIPNANTMTDYLRRVNYSQTTQQVAETTQATLLSGTASYFGF